MQVGSCIIPYLMNSPAFQSLLGKLKELDRLGSVQSLTSWDEQVNLPPGSASLRGEQSEVLAKLIHKEASSPEIGEWLEELEAEDLSEEQQLIIRQARRDYDRVAKLPPEFSARKAAAQSAGYHAWVEARKADDFSAFLPHLETHLALAHEEADFLEAPNAYDYWIDRFDPGVTQSFIEPLFTSLAPELRELTEQILSSGVEPDTSLFTGFPEEAQHAVLLQAVKAMGFDFRIGRIDRAVHPFCGGHPRDCRMTTRYDVNNPLDSLTSAMHETGHALYEQGLPDTYPGTALSNSAGMAIHESQSRLWENQVGRSREFWDYFEPIYRAAFPEQLADVDSAALYLAINRVAITPIRVDADEVTYNLHIMLRFELEQRLFAGDLKPADLPSAWSEASKRYLGFEPTSNTEGCLQDVHWSEGIFGYFPSYTLGNLLAAQLWERIREDLPEWQSDFRQGCFTALLSWLRGNLHSLGKRYPAPEFSKVLTGRELGTGSLMNYLRERYLPLYTK